MHLTLGALSALLLIILAYRHLTTALCDCYLEYLLIFPVCFEQVMITTTNAKYDRRAFLNLQSTNPESSLPALKSLL